MRFIISSAVVAALIASTPFEASAMKVEPGKWEFKNTATMMAGQPPKTNVSTECIDDGEVDPDKFLEGDETCQISDVDSTASKLTWKMTCPNPHGTMTGDAILTSTGKTVTGSMDMRMEFSGQVMNIKNNWEGKRIGPCD